MTQSLLRGRHVILDPGADPSRGIIENGAVLVEGAVVKATGPYAALKEQYPHAPEIGSERHLLMPGLVNAHHHGRGLMGIQLGMLDEYFEPWLLSYWQQKPLSVYLDTLYANIRLLRSGVTTVIHSGYSRDWSQTEAEVKSSLSAYDDSGLRVAYAVGVEDQNTFVYQDNAAFIGSLPADLGRRVREALFRLGPSERYDYFTLVAHLLRTYADHPRIRIFYGPTGPEWCSPELLRKIGALGRDQGAGIHLHCLESPLQRDYALRTLGKPFVHHLRDVGILGERTSLAHATWIGEDEIRLCADFGAAVCHNASSNLRLHNGIAPVVRMRELGVKVGIGMDGWTINSDDDMFQEMRLASYLHRAPRLQRAGSGLTAIEILRMAMQDGAAASGFGDQIGRLTPGALADAVLLDFDQMAAPYLDPRTPLADALVALGRASHVDIVMVGGEVLVRKGRYLKSDEPALLRELAEIAHSDPPAHFQEFCAVIEDLKPYVRQFYDRWPKADTENPVYTVNTVGRA